MRWLLFSQFYVNQRFEVNIKCLGDHVEGGDSRITLSPFNPPNLG